jgi:hypothetical protein
MASWLGGPGAWLGGPAACLGGLREVGPGDDEGEADGVDEYTETKTALAEALAKSSISIALHHEGLVIDVAILVGGSMGEHGIHDAQHLVRQGDDGALVSLAVRKPR